MSNLKAFVAYAAAFDESLVNDNWSRIEQYFSEDASYKPGDGTEGIGRNGAIQSLQDSVNALERKCDARELIGQPGVTEEGDTITLSFTIKYTKQGVQYSAGLISKMEDVFENPNDVMAWRNSL